VTNPKNRAARASSSSRAVLRVAPSHPAVRNYLLICLGALFALVVCLADRGMEWWSLAPSFVGCLTLLARWSNGPTLVLLSLTGLLGLSGPNLFRGYRYGGYSQSPSAMDFVLCVVMLAYVAGHYRLLSLTRRLFPNEPRRQGSEKDEGTVARRSVDLVTSWEMILFGASLLIFPSLALMLWSWLREGSPPSDMPAPIWRLLQIVWIVFGGLAAAALVANYLRMTSATPGESLLYLQDEVWRPTRREQGVLNRWLTWARLRSRRRRETP
jgi:hypothetical protein